MPNRYRHLSRLRGPLRRLGPQTRSTSSIRIPGTVLCPAVPAGQKAANASGLRRGLQPIASETAKSPSPTPLPPPPARGIGPVARANDRHGRPPPDCRPPTCLRTKWMTRGDKRNARALRPQMEPVHPQRADRGATRHRASSGIVLLARATTCRRWRLRPGHRRTRLRQIRRIAHPLLGVAWPRNATSTSA